MMSLVSSQAAVILPLSVTWSRWEYNLVFLDNRIPRTSFFVVDFSTGFYSYSEGTFVWVWARDIDIDIHCALPTLTLGKTLKHRTHSLV